MPSSFSFVPGLAAALGPPARPAAFVTPLFHAETSGFAAFYARMPRAYASPTERVKFTAGVPS